MPVLNKKGLFFFNIIVGVLATMMVMFPALIFKDTETSFTGLEVAFGHEFANLGTIASGQIKFNIFVLLAYSLPFVGVILLVLSRKVNQFTILIFIASAVLIFLIPEFTEVSVTLLGNETVIDVSWTYGIGLILAASFSTLGSLIGLANLLTTK